MRGPPFAGAILVAGGGGFILFFLAAGIAAVRSRALPRWAAWSAIVIGVLWLLPNPGVIFLTFIWTIAVGIFLLIREPGAHVAHRVASC